MPKKFTTVQVSDTTGDAMKNKCLVTIAFIFFGCEVLNVPKPTVDRVEKWNGIDTIIRGGMKLWPGSGDIGTVIYGEYDSSGFLIYKLIY